MAPRQRNKENALSEAGGVDDVVGIDRYLRTLGGGGDGCDVAEMAVVGGERMAKMVNRSQEPWVACACCCQLPMVCLRPSHSRPPLLEQGYS